MGRGNKTSKGFCDPSITNVSTIWLVAGLHVVQTVEGGPPFLVQTPSERQALHPTNCHSGSLHPQHLLASNSSPNLKAHEFSKVRIVSRTPASVGKHMLSTSFPHPYPNLTLILSSRLQFIHIPPSQVRLPAFSSCLSTYNRKRMNSLTRSHQICLPIRY